MCDVKARCRERNAMDAEKRWRERRRTAARGDVDKGVGRGGVAWGTGSPGCVGLRAGLITPGAVATQLSEPPRDRETSPAAAPASAPLAAGACGPRGSGAVPSVEPRRARRFAALASTDLPAPALGRTPRLRRRLPAMRPRLRALGRAPHGARGVSLRLRRRYPSGAAPGAQRPGVRAPRARWHERRSALPGASPRSPLRRDVTALAHVAIAASTRVGPGVDAGRRQRDTLGRRIAADGRRSASQLQRCMRHSGLDFWSTTRGFTSSSSRRGHVQDEHLGYAATVAMSRYRAHWIEYAVAPERMPAIAKSVSDR